MIFEIIDKITKVEIIAIGNRIREIARLRKEFGPGRWQKLKGETSVRLINGKIRRSRYIGMRLTELDERK